MQFPEALRPAFPRLKEKLEDGEPGDKIKYTINDITILIMTSVDFFTCLKDIIVKGRECFVWRNLKS